MTLDDILSHFNRPVKRGSGWNVQCPAHEDKHQSLSISPGNKGYVLKCHAGCETPDILDRADLTYADLFYDSLPEPIPMRQKTIVDTYDYTSEDGELLFQVVRYDPKDFRQRAPDGKGGWHWGLNGARRVLYRLPEVVQAKPGKIIFLCAGEKDAENVRSLGLIATTKPMGEGSWGEEYSESLRDRSVVVLCDNDVAGIKHGTVVREQLQGIAKSVHVIHFPELPEHGDVSDWIALGHGRGDLLERVRAEIDTKSVEKPSFPVDVFPPLVRQFITYGAEATNVPVDMVAVPFLSIVAAAIGNSLEIQLRSKWKERANIWTAVIGTPGSGKSPASAYAMTPLNNLQSEAVKDYRNKMDYWSREQELATPKEKKELPPPPRLEHYYTNDSTIEGIIKMLGESSGILIERDEIVGWVQSHDAYKKGGDRAAYLSLWSGKPIKKDRSGSETIYVEHPVLPITGGIQPDMLPQLASDAGRDGFVERFLFTWPDPMDAVVPDVPDDYAMESRITELLRTIRADVPRGQMITLTLTPDAKTAFDEWWLENTNLAKQASGLVSGFYSKYNGYLGKIAIVLHALNTVGQKDARVPKETIEDAITVIEYFRSYLNYVLPSFDTAPSASFAGAASRVYRALHRTPGEWVVRRDLNTRLGNNIPAKELESILSEMQAKGSVELRRTVPEGGGRPRLESRSVIPNLDDWVL